MLTTLMLSQGVPMMLAGDEMGRTQQGNNNAYCQDNEINWLSWQQQSVYQQELKPFFADLAMTPPNMKDVKFCVLAIGDSSYDTFCAAGHQAFDALLDIGTTPLFDLTCIDILANPVPEDAADPFITSLISAI